MTCDPYAEPRYEIESERWYEAVARGEESGASDRSYLARTRTDREVGLIYAQVCFTVSPPAREEN